MSIDNVVIDYYISETNKRESFIKVLQYISLKLHCDVDFWESYKIGSYRNQFRIRFGDGTSFWIGIGLVQAKTNWGKVRLDFNPNKTAKHECFRHILAVINSISRSMHTTIKRFDLAVDLPVLRTNVFLVKDARAYRAYRHGQEFTEYLGPKSNVGHVKLYNKQAESKLHYPLTRLEMTLSPQQLHGEIRWPKVFSLNDYQLSFDNLPLSDTDRFILQALLQGYGSLSQLGRRTRKKMEQLMKGYVTAIEIPHREYTEILYQLATYPAFPKRLFTDMQEVDPDRNPVLYPSYDEFIEIMGNDELPW